MFIQIKHLSIVSLLRILILVAIIVNVLGFIPPLMDIDSTLYAGIAKNMVQNHDWINLYVQGNDWLDKPHFQLWIAAIFYKLFGINAFAFRFSSFIFFILSMMYTYFFTKTLLKSKHNIIPLLSVLILSTAQHILLSNYDVKAEIIIMGLLIACMYHLLRRNESFLHLILAALFMACAIMTKGIFLIIPALSLWTAEAIFKRQFFFFVNWQFILFILFVFIFITPELFCLYLQFDRNPEKIIFGQQHVSGIRFFFWDSQFGRFFNTGPIKGRGDLFFFFHTILWAFFPWCLILYWSFFKDIRYIWKNPAILKLISIVLPLFIVFSISRFQLPHYIIIIFPFFAILTAKYIAEFEDHPNDFPPIIFRMTQIFGFLVLLIFGLVLVLYFGFIEYIYITLLVNVFCIILFIFFFRNTTFKKFLIQSILPTVFINIVLFTQFYPNLLKYQYGYTVNQYIQKNNIQKIFVMSNLNVPSIYFYDQGNIIFTDEIPHSTDTVFILCDRMTRDTLYPNFYTVQSFPRFHISRLNIKFLNHTTRVVDSVYIIRNQK